MKVTWEPVAEADLAAIITYLADRSVTAASRLLDKITATAAELEALPERYRKGSVAGTRELVIAGTPYILVYIPGAEEVRIIALFHAAQDKPRGPGDP